MNKKHHKIGLALGSGGSRGLAHIGVINILTKHRVPIDMIAGTSAGSIVGALYAFSLDIEWVESIFRSISYEDLLTIAKDLTLHTAGVVKGNSILDFLKKHLGEVTFKELKLPFTAVATDINSGQIIRMNEGVVAEAVRASCSLPFTIEPYQYKQHFLVDGGTAEPVPVESIIEMGASKTIAVNLDSHFFSSVQESENPETKIMPSAARAALRSFSLFRYHLAKANTRLADIAIEPYLPYNLWDATKIDEIIKTGADFCEEQIPQILELISNERE